MENTEQNEKTPSIMAEHWEKKKNTRHTWQTSSDVPKWRRIYSDREEATRYWFLHNKEIWSVVFNIPPLQDLWNTEDSLTLPSPFVEFAETGGNTIRL
jgi:hypothetical protein